MALDARFELFDHTADVGVRVFSPTLAGLVEPAARGLYAVIGELSAAGAPTTAQLEFAADDPALLLRDYLAELLRRFETHKEIAVGVSVVEFEERRLTAAAQMRPLDPTRSVLEREAKAVTYHQLEIRLVPGGFQATFVVDI